MYWFRTKLSPQILQQNCPHVPTGRKPKVRPRTRRRDCISALAWSCLGVELAELSEISVDPEVFRVLLDLLSSWVSPMEKRARKWVNEWVCRLTIELSIHRFVFSLFANSECRIQIIKHIWTKTCVFVKIS